jgi:hypothetical protein
MFSPMQSSEELARSGSRTENQPLSNTYDVFILLTRAAKLELTRLFDIQAENAFPGRTEDEELLIQHFSPESTSLYEAYVSWLRQNQAIGRVSAFLVCPVFQGQQRPDAEVDEEYSPSRRVALAEDVLASIATGWIATDDFSPDQLLIVQEALQEYLERRRGSENDTASDTSLAARVRQARENIILYIDDPDEQCDLSPLSTALDLLEAVLQDIEHPPTDAIYVSVWDGGTRTIPIS